MELFIHFGIYKAGSSYLQHIAANSKPYLEEKKIYFPTSNEDKKMIQGFISKGNADGLEKTLKENNRKHCTKILLTWKKEAERKNCTKVLISAEALVHQLAIEQALETLILSSKNAGYGQVHAMGFFRDLVDHAISTYKHRAKSGKIPDYKHWIENTYETPKLLENLVATRKLYTEIDWVYRKFQKDSQFLKQVFFKDWLQIEIPNFEGMPTVNESVTISEIVVMNEIRKKYPSVTDYFVDDLKAIPKKEKAKDTILEDCFYKIFYFSLKKHNEILKNINTYFPSSEKLEIGNCKENGIYEVSSLSICLSEVQFKCLLQRITFFTSMLGMITRLRRHIVKVPIVSSILINHFKSSRR